MRKEAIKEAATLEEAKEAAAREIGLDVQTAQFEILQMPQKKTLGLFGGCPARVKAFAEVSPADKAAEYLRGVLRQMGAGEVSIDVKVQGEGCVLTLNGDDVGFIIGRRGETLDALQYLTGLVANRVDNAYYRVTIDVGNYREKRDKTLAELARKVGGQAAKTGRKTSLEPMNPYERRIIHTTVQEIEGATSWSVGSEPNRFVVVGPSDDNPVRRESKPPRERGARGGRPNDRARAGERSERPQREARRSADGVPERPVRQVREFVPRSNPLPMADGGTPPEKTISEKEQSATLYGRIDL